MTIWAPAFLSASLVVSGLAHALAQKPTAPAAKPDYSRESTVFDRIDTTYRYAADGTGAREITGVVEVHDQASVKALSVLTFPFASASEHVEIDYVRVRHADGSVVTTPAADVQEQPSAVTREAPFYSDLKEDQVPVRSLREGDIIEYHVVIPRTKAEAPGHFWGTENFFTISSGLVVLSQTIELDVPKASYVKTWSPHAQPVITNTDTETVYRWHSAQLQPVAGKSKNDLLRLEDDPTLGLDDDPRPPTIQWTNFHSWAEVGAWYRTLEGVRTEPDDDVRAKLATVTAGKSTPEEKARAIFAYVGPQVRYIGVAFGIGRYQPHEAGDVLRNQYGDCKDKTTLLASMLNAAVVPTDAALIGVNVAFTPEVPSPGAFNHAINLAHLDGHAVWLDSTAEVAPFGMLQSPIRGKQALVIPLTGDAHLETTPKDPPFPATQNFTAIGSLDEKGTSHSRITLEMRGDDEITFRQAVRSVSPAQWDQLMQQISQAMSYAGKVSKTEFSRPDDTSTPFRAAYDYEREKSGDWDNLRIIPQLAPVGLGDVDEKDLPVRAIPLGNLQTETSHAVMQLPKGWRADLPPAVHAHAPFATLDKTYSFDNGTLTTDLRVVILAESVPAKDWKAYHQWFKDASLDGESFIQLTAGSANGLATPQRIKPSDNNPAAADLIQQAAQAGQQNDWATAKSRLDQAKAISPHQVRLWAMYGALAATKNNANEAIKDFKREIDEHPEETQAYTILAQFQMQKGKTDDAIATLQSAINRDPADASNVLYLASLQTGRNDYAGAEKSLRAGLAAQPANDAIKLALGSDLLKVGKQDEAVQLLQAIIASSDDPGQLNNAAYALGDANLSLPLAEKAARRSLDLLDTASSKGETGRTALNRTNLIIDTWDTLGWIIFREGKPAEAEPWIRSAWRNGNHAEPGYHLAVVLEALHRTEDARAQIELASVGSGASDAVKQLIETKRQQLHAESLKTNPTLDLQHLRTYELPRNDLKHVGFATVELELTSTGTASVHLIDGDDSLEPLFPAIKTLNLDLPLPPGSHATLLRRGVLSCPSAPTCQLVLVSTTDALTQ